MQDADDLRPSPILSMDHQMCSAGMKPHRRRALGALRAISGNLANRSKRTKGPSACRFARSAPRVPVPWRRIRDRSAAAVGMDQPPFPARVVEHSGLEQASTEDQTPPPRRSTGCAGIQEEWVSGGSRARPVLERTGQGDPLPAIAATKGAYPDIALPAICTRPEAMRRRDRELAAELVAYLGPAPGNAVDPRLVERLELGSVLRFQVQQPVDEGDLACDPVWRGRVGLSVRRPTWPASGVVRRA